MKITKEVTVSISKDQAFRKFPDDFNEWWPKEYTWSKDKLVEISIQ
ncbi:hypothetical protein [Christiangramia fulva]|nr:hypothetical protein [Christiangramia fulva]